MKLQSCLQPAHRYYLLLLLLNTLTISLSSQSIINGRIMVNDDDPLPYANVVVLAPDSTFVKGTLTDEEGNFKVSIGEIATAWLRVSAVGYSDQWTSLVTDQLRYDIKVLPAAHSLDAVTVRGHKMLYELQNDRLVINVGATPALSGNTALQVLQKSPGIVVDQQNNRISINSRGSVLLMIDNRIQRIPVEALMARLESIPAENIERVEIIHQPSAKYDVAGGAGIVHLVLKKREGNGTNGSYNLMGGYGQREKAGVGLSINHRNLKWNVYGDYAFNLNRHDNYTVNHFRSYDYQGTQFDYENYVDILDREVANHSVNLGADLFLPNGGILGGLVTYTHSSDQFKDMSSVSSAFENEQLVNNAIFYLRGDTRIRTALGNLNWQQPLSARSEINLDFDFAQLNFLNNGLGQSLDPESPREIISDRVTPIKIWTAQGDWEHRAEGGVSWEAGVKATFSDIDSESIVEDVDNPNFIGSVRFNGQASIDERILAAYTTYRKDFSSRVSGELGLRFESFRYDLQASREEDNLSAEFNNLFPIVRLQFKADSANIWQLSFNRAMTRPGFWQLAGYFIFLDPTILAASNPSIQPAFANNYRLSFQHRTVLGSLTYTRSRNAFFYYNTVDKPNHIQTSIPSNLDRSESVELGLSWTNAPTDWWENSINLSGMYHWVSDEVGRELAFKNDLITYSVQFNSSFTLGKTWTASVDGRYMSDYMYGDQIQYLYPYLNLGLRKRLRSGSTLSFSFQDITNTAGRIEWSYDQPAQGVRTFGNNNWSERQIRITYLSTFGSDRIKSKRQRETGQDVRSRM